MKSILTNKSKYIKRHTFKLEKKELLILWFIGEIYWLILRRNLKIWGIYIERAKAYYINWNIFQIYFSKEF